MTNKERIRNCIRNKPVDRAPFFLYFGPWPETEERWTRECGEFDLNAPGYDAGVTIANSYFDAGIFPKFPYEVLAQDGDKITYRDEIGAVMRCIRGKSGIPEIVSSPVKNRADWERYKAERLDPDAPGRFPDDWDEIAGRLNESEAAVQLGCYPFGLFGTLRDLMGVEDLLVAFYDDPELVRDMMDHLTDFWIKIYTKVCKSVRPDLLHIWEDMSGKAGPLISPDMIREFMVPNYQKFKAFADRFGIAGMIVDTDGNCDLLIPPFMEGGVDLILPFEVAAGSDVVKIKEKYPELALMGGIDKQKLSGSFDEIDRELERIEPLLKGSGYFPAMDHLIPPEISWENYLYYSARLKEMILKNGR